MSSKCHIIVEEGEKQTYILSATVTLVFTLLTNLLLQKNNIIFYKLAVKSQQSSM